MLSLITGFFSGILSGMGVGGGMLLIPLLKMFFDISQKNAQAVNLFSFIPASIGALIIHIKKKNVDFKAAVPMIITGIPFSLLGAYLCIKISPDLLEKLFGVFILIFGVREILMSFREIKMKKYKKKASHTN